MELTLAQAASRLGVTTRQAQRLAHDGQLQIVRRIGRTVIVEDSAIAQRRHVCAHRGRRWNASTAWAAIELLEDGFTERVSGSTRTRLKIKLSQVSVEEFARLAAGRAQTRRMTQTRRRTEVLEKALVQTGRSALKHADTAARFGLASGGSEIVEGYVRRSELDSVLARFGLEADAEGEVFLHVSDEDAVESVVTTALDLYERGTTRERSAAREILKTALHR
jgi:hypothetical protein